MKYSKCYCKTPVHISTLASELDGLQGEDFKVRLAEVIGSYCPYDNNSKFGRAFNRIESAQKGSQVFNYSVSGDDWTFTATIICEDWEDEINADFMPYFELTKTDITVIKSRISEYLGLERVKKQFPADMAARIENRKKGGFTLWGAVHSELSDGIPKLIKTDLENAINDIFVKYQTALNIESGDIEPLKAYDLEVKTDAMTALIAEVLKAQYEDTLQ